MIDRKEAGTQKSADANRNSDRKEAATQSVAAGNENLTMKVSPQAQIHARRLRSLGAACPFRIEDSGFGGRAAAARRWHRGIDRDVERVRAAFERGTEEHRDMKRVTERRGDDLRKCGA